MPWWTPTALLSTSPPSSTPSPKSISDDDRTDATARRQERLRKPRHPREADIGSPLPSATPSTSNSRGSSVTPDPQPLPLPELSQLLRRDGYAASQRLPSPNDRFTQSGRFSDFKMGGLNEGANTRMEPSSRRPSRKAPQNLKFVDVESNKFILPYKSAPTSPYTSPSLSPQRRGTGEMFSSYIKSPQNNQMWSAPEMPFSDGYTGFLSPASPEQIKYSPDSLNSRSPPYDLRNSSRATSPMNKKAAGDASPRATSHTNSHPLPLPPGASQPSSIAAAQHAPLSPFHRPSAPLPAVPQVPTRTEFSSAKNWQKGKLIGRGTFGSVYVATNLQTGALCAMKEVELIPDDPKSTECMKQLEQEINLLSQLQHPNIVQYYGSQIVGDKLYIFLEYVHPGAISKYIRDHCGAITEAVVRNFTRHILSGLAYLHSKRTVHRDIKGANLLVDSAGVVKLADFGMAKHLTGQAAQLSLKGSPYWMAPELMQSVMQKDMKPDLACAVDIWSLGCTIIEMLNGKPPWSEYEGAAAMFKVMRESPPIPNTLSPEGKDFLQCCFRRNPAERPTSNALLEHPFLRNSQQDVQSCVNGLNRMLIKDDVFSSEASYSYNHEKLTGISEAQMKPLRPPESYMNSSLYPVRQAASSALT